MPRLTWSKLMEKHAAGHLILVRAADADDAGRLMGRLLEAQGVPGPWSLRVASDRGEPAVQIVFGEKRDADRIARLFDARPIGRFPGWRSQREFDLDRKTESKIVKALEDSAGG